MSAVPPVVPELSSDDDYSHFDDIPEPDSGEEFFPTPKVCLKCSWICLNGLDITIVLDENQTGVNKKGY